MDDCSLISRHTIVTKCSNHDFQTTSTDTSHSACKIQALRQRFAYVLTNPYQAGMAWVEKYLIFLSVSTWRRVHFVRLLVFVLSVVCAFVSCLAFTWCSILLCCRSRPAHVFKYSKCTPFVATFPQHYLHNFVMPSSSINSPPHRGKRNLKQELHQRKRRLKLQQLLSQGWSSELSLYTLFTIIPQTPNL